MRYYSIMRPVSIGTCPSKGITSVNNFAARDYVESIGRPAWGYVEYDHELSESDCRNYELVPEGCIERKPLEVKAGRLLMEAGYSGKEALETVRTISIEELKAICEEG